MDFLKKRGAGLCPTPLKRLSYQDSNLDRQNQKLQCYHYTIRQSSMLQSLATIPPGIMRTLKANAKLRFFSDISKPIS